MRSGSSRASAERAGAVLQQVAQAPTRAWQPPPRSAALATRTLGQCRAEQMLAEEISVTPSNTVAFRRRAPSRQELEAYRWLTRSWSPAMRRLMFPQFHALETLST